MRGCKEGAPADEAEDGAKRLRFDGSIGPEFRGARMAADGSSWRQGNETRCRA